MTHRMEFEPSQIDGATAHVKCMLNGKGKVGYGKLFVEIQANKEEAASYNCGGQELSGFPVLC